MGYQDATYIEILGDHKIRGKKSDKKPNWEIYEAKSTRKRYYNWERLFQESVWSK